MIKKNVISTFGYLRLKSFGTETEASRTAERYRLAWLGAIATITSRAAGMGLMVLTVNWAAPALGAERFGIWATFSSLTAMLSFLDLGVGNALINKVAHAAASGDSDTVTSIVTAALGWLIGIGLASAAVLTIASSLIPWLEFFHPSSPYVAVETKHGALVFSGLFGLSLISGGLLKVLVGQQRSYEAQLIGTLCTMLSVLPVWYCINHRPSVGSLLVAGFGVQSSLMLIFAVAILKLRRMIKFRIIATAMREHRTSIMVGGSFFLTLQIGTMIGWGSDSVLIASFSGASNVAAFAVAQRLFQFASQPSAVMNSALWPAYADAFARGDTVFLRGTLKRSLLYGVLMASTLSVVLLLTGPRIIPFWTKGSIPVPWLLLLSFAIWTCLESAGSALAMYLNGVGIVKIQIIVVAAFCAVAIPAKINAVIHYGPGGLVFATSASYLLTVYFLYGFVFRSSILAPIARSSAR